MAPALRKEGRRRFRFGTTAVLIVIVCVGGGINLIAFRSYTNNARQQTATSIEMAVKSKTARDPQPPPSRGAPDDHPLAGLDCEAHGGPSNEAAAEMIFWEDIESDSKYKSPFLRQDETQYLTFEPDHGGWNNIRMAFETGLVMAHAMGRTLVLPPQKKVYLLGDNEFTFNDFFHMDSIAFEHDGLDVISMQEFLEREGITGNLRDEKGIIVKPPADRVNWNGKGLAPLERYLRKVGVFPMGWDPSECVGAFPSSRDPKDVEMLKTTMDDILGGKYGPLPDNEKDYDGKPTPVDAPVADRLREMLGGRKKLCIYDEQLQDAKLIHMAVTKGGADGEKSRLLTHFYAFLFFQSYMDDLYYKRFVRDHVRYADMLTCAAARVVAAMRERAKGVGDNPEGKYDSMHIRRGDFQYKKTRISAEEIYDRSKDELTEGSAVYIATDERNKSFFDPLRKHYKLFFLDDFKEEIKGVKKEFYGMIDQLVASRGATFFGTWWSTLSGYINRMRGYASQRNKLDGYLDGTIKSYYFIPEERKNQMIVYKPVKLPIYMREFPTAWRDIDRNIEDIHVENVRQQTHKQS